MLTEKLKKGDDIEREADGLTEGYRRLIEADEMDSAGRN
jgi:hypothetical protein